MMKNLIYVLVSWVFYNVLFRDWWDENAIFAHSLTGLIKSMILDILEIALEISHCTLGLLE